MDRIFGAIKESPAASMFAGSIAVVYTARGLLGRKPRPIAPSPIAWKGLHYKSLFLVDGKASSPARKKKSPNRRLKSKVSPSDYYDRMVSPSKVHTPEKKMKVHASPSPFSRLSVFPCWDCAGFPLHPQKLGLACQQPRPACAIRRGSPTTRRCEAPAMRPGDSSSWGRVCRRRARGGGEGQAQAR